jgi:hypothetical protein
LDLVGGGGTTDSKSLRRRLGGSLRRFCASRALDRLTVGATRCGSTQRLAL